MRWVLGIWAVFATILVIWVLVGIYEKYPAGVDPQSLEYRSNALDTYEHQQEQAKQWSSADKAANGISAAPTTKDGRWYCPLPKDK